MTQHVLRFEPFDAAYTVALGSQARDAALQSWGYSPDDDSAAGALYTCTMPSGVVGFVMALPKRKNMALINHEALHLVVGMLAHHGVPVGVENQELLCHFQDYAVRSIVAVCYPTRGRRK